MFPRTHGADGIDRPAYALLGLNETLRIRGVGYFYEPNSRLWERGSCPPELDYDLYLSMPARMNAESIHDWMLSGAPVVPWSVGQAGHFSLSHRGNDDIGPSEQFVPETCPASPIPVESREEGAPEGALDLPQSCPEDESANLDVFDSGAPAGHPRGTDRSGF